MKPLISLMIKVLVPALILAGCSAVTYKYDSRPASGQVEADLFRITFTPEKGEDVYYSWFQLDVENLSGSPIEIDWSRTAYVLDGKNRGPFVWEGIEPQQVKDRTVPPSTVAPGQKFSLEISPLAKVAIAHRSDYSAGKDKPGLYGGILPPGENGIVLVIRVDGQLVRKKLAVTITEERE